ncbi:short-chain dehydrogenase [bacterium]|nr:MAG: short-chain dehydrogenase [bacterium]RKZ16773.1 MAG: short-chain dehydrogenase [bacterium]
MPAGQIVIITGASRGIGHNMAMRFAQEGARVIAVARDAERLEELAGRFDEGRILPIVADVCEPSSIDALRDRVLTDLGVPHLLVANAGRLGPIGPTWESDAASWWKDVEVNLRGSFLLAHAFLPSMVDEGRGRVVLFGGGGSTRVFPWASSYAMSKAAVLRLAETIDLELADTGLHAFAVSPGFVRTEMTERFAATEDGRRYITDLAERLDQGQTTPPESCAELLVRIASGDLDALHGRFLHAALDLDQLDKLVARADQIAADDERVLGLKGFSL